ncbi:hypothetical protein [Lentilactobacillus sp. Marseille-Q4993]|uniref:hypothetical protein n=1 Tax=Lentilactobacillus sp. Marseille-Q4993 TaxID=3039492 RepID=UPI0024BC297D|nr:hypothetical protein [Lentilactobacillus sp. Marseille-Q4993]
MKTKQIALILLSTTLLGLGGMTVSAGASSWHKGSPKVLRGTWKNEGYPVYKITKNKLTVYGKGGGTGKVSYKKTGHNKYSLKFKVQGYHYTDKFTYISKHKAKARGLVLTR